MFFSCGCYDCGQTYLKLFLACFFLSISKLIPNFLFLTQGEFMHESKSQCKRHWHPAFFAGLQIELSEERSNLIFENEHLLGTKPTQIDVIIVKKNGDIPIKKNIKARRIISALMIFIKYMPMPASIRAFRDSKIRLTFLKSQLLFSQKNILIDSSNI